MKAPIRLGALCALLAFSATTACDQDKTETADSSGDSTPKSPEEKAAKNKETVDALLRQNGIDPNTVKPLGADPGAAPAQKAAAPQPGPGAEANNGKVSKIEVLSFGTGPKQTLKYKFEKGRTRKFSMDMTITPNRSVNGQPMPSMPGVQIGISGTTQTMEFSDDRATRLNTFLEFNPGSEGLPPMLVEQMKAQFDALKGTQLTEVVSAGGQVLDLRVPTESQNNPQIMALLQNLQDGMTNSYLPLPAEPVGVGAKWKASNIVQAAGISVTQVNEITLKSMKGDSLTVDLTFSQSAPPQKVEAPELPPETQVELTGMKGGGTGTMTLNLATLVTDSQVNLSMTVDTKISGPGAPQPVLSSTDTGMKIHLKVSE